MHFSNKFTTSVAVALMLASQAAASAIQGFNYGATDSSGAPYTQSQYEALFQTAKGLVGASGFDSARLYTMIQGGSTNTPISAIPAAIKQNTTLLLGMWASAGSAQFQNELAALSNAISTYGSELGDLVVGISVGSEDLYRDSQMGIEAKAGVGAGPDVILDYINQVKKAISNTPLSNVPIGHVDTWTAWVNGTSQPVIEALDWLGFDAYPYFQNTMPNSIDVGKQLFWDAYQETSGVANGKDVWVTETGWPVSGNVSNQAIASIENAQTYWDEVGCALFGKVNTYWYILQDADPVTPNPSFGIVGSDLSTTPLYNLTCPAVVSSTSSAPASSSSAASSSASSAAASSSASSAAASATSTGSANADTFESSNSTETSATAATSSTAVASSVASGSSNSSSSGSTSSSSSGSSSNSGSNSNSSSSSSSSSGSSSSSSSSSSQASSSGSSNSSATTSSSGSSDSAIIRPFGIVAALVAGLVALI